METLANVRHGPTDRRAAVRIVRNGNVTPWVPAPIQPATIMDDVDFGNLIARVPANLHIVNGYAGSKTGARGLAIADDMDSITVSTRDERVWLHELVHGAGIDQHRNDNDNNLMHEKLGGSSGIGAGNLLNNDDREELESAGN